MTNSINNSGSEITVSSININGSTISTLSNAILNLNPNGTGKVFISNAYKFPNADGNPNQILYTNGSGQLNFGRYSTVNILIFTSSGTYTPSLGLVQAYVELCGGGGGSGGCVVTTSTTVSATAGGGGGGYAAKLLSSATIGASQTLTIGLGGTSGTPTISGGTGGTTSFGAIFSATGGSGSSFMSTAVTSFVGLGGLPGSGVSGDINISGTAGKDASGFVYSAAPNPGVSNGGDSGGSYFAPYLSRRYVGGNGADGIAGNLYGGGAAGAYNYLNLSSSSDRNGAAGAQGIAIITEFIQ